MSRFDSKRIGMATASLGRRSAESIEDVTARENGDRPALVRLHAVGERPEQRLVVHRVVQPQYSASFGEVPD
jgi:hypothetical protein